MQAFVLYALSLAVDSIMLYIPSFSEQNKEYHNWHCMPFREDFRKKLMKYGQLPNPSMKDHFEMMQ